MLRGLVARARRWGAALGRLPAAVLCVAALATAVMYCSNNNLDADPSAPRGDGRYRPVMARGDGHMHFLITRSIVFDRDVNFDNDLAEFGDPWNQPRTVTGRKNVMQQIGPSLIWAPMLAVTHGLAVVANVFGAGIQTHGYTMFHQRILFASSVVFAWLAVALGLLVARRLVGGRWSPVWAAVAVLLGTTLTYYATFMPSYAHAMDAAACAGFLALWFVTLGELRWRRYIALGILLGIAAMVRIQDIAFGVVLALELGVLAWHQVRSDAPDKARAALVILGKGAAVLGIAVVMHAPQLYMWKVMYGSWWTTPQGPGQMRYAHPMILELLFSPRNGWLSTHPLAYLGVIGLALGAISGPRLGPRVRIVCGALLLAIAAQVYVNAVTYEWWSAASFGQRRMASSTLPLVVGIAVLLRWVHLRVGTRLSPRVQQAVAICILGYFVAWNLAWVSRLTHGRSAGRDNLPTCCSDVPAPLSWIARPVYRLVGNPFEFPANALFAVRHGVGLARWDVAVGSYALVPGVLGYQDGSYKLANGTWNQAGPGGAPYLLDGWGPPQRDAGPPSQPFRWTTDDRAEMLLPLLMPEPHRITMPIVANVTAGEHLDVEVLCNGASVARASVGGAWTTITFDTDGAIGSNEIAIVAKAWPYRLPPHSSPAPPPGVAVVGVAIGPLHVALPR
jgi:hypothetical protein